MPDYESLEGEDFLEATEIKKKFIRRFKEFFKSEERRFRLRDKIISNSRGKQTEVKPKPEATIESKVIVKPSTPKPIEPKKVEPQLASAYELEIYSAQN